ncbi:putative disease resistance protein At1g59780 [Carex rostrata]
MDALLLTIELLSQPDLPDLFEKFKTEGGKYELLAVQKRLSNKKLRVLLQDKNQAIIERMRLIAYKVGNFVGEIVEQKGGSSKQSSDSRSHDFNKDWDEIKYLIFAIMGRLDVSFFNSINIYCDNIESIEEMLLETSDCSNYGALKFKKQGLVLLMKKVIPAAVVVPWELYSLPSRISKACKKQPLALLLIGGLLSFKPMTYDTWNKVSDDLRRLKIKEVNMRHIINYCYDDLPYFLQLCFLYFACFPIGYEIPATSLIHIWIAEGFVIPDGELGIEGPDRPKEDQETKDEMANQYLEQLVQRSLVCVSKRSFLGTIKTCRVPRPIHEFAIEQSSKDEFLVANPDQEKMESLFRVAIHQDNKKQYTEVKNNHMHSFIAFNFDRTVLGSATLLRVLELRNSAIPETALPNMLYLQYLGLRGSNISELPKNIGDMKYLQTLDVRDTSIETLPESLWNIKKLRRVYVKPSSQIKGPPCVAPIDSLHTLKTVAAHESWVENIPHFLIHLRKLALWNKGILKWEDISNLLSQMDKLISMAIISNIIPSESVDLRAFPNLETVKSIKLEGKWICRKLFIDNVKFPPNLAKLTLTNSGLKEDPMPTLERLQALKFLSIKDGAYTGKQMICSGNGFPHLKFLELANLENLENWEIEFVMDGSVKKMGIPQLTTLRVIQCLKLNKLPNLDHVTHKLIG